MLAFSLRLRHSLGASAIEPQHMHSDEEHLDTWGGTMTASLASAITAWAPAPPVRLRLRERVLAAAADGTEVVRADEGTWHTVLPGVEIRCLRRDAGAKTQTCEWRLAPGASIPAHAHHMEEECMVLQGEIHHGGEIYRSGDYLLARAGTRQHNVHSPRGALLLIRGDILG